ncbi:BrnT family toxin [Nostoc sp.]|uniref:BrnT family toxin n=1 Tax=Nostoc sp. TaxID=1180 RepID=UPI003FA55A99
MNLRYDLDMEFEWDKSKATANLTKHGVSFEETKTVFDNVLAVIFDDEAHSVGEKRDIIIGHSRNNRLLLISFTERSNAIRIISARLATRKEHEDYEQNAF